MQIRGFPVAIGGTYVLLDDVVTALREFAQSLADPEQGAVVHEVATWLVSGERTSEFPFNAADPHAVDYQEPGTVEIYGAEADDNIPDVDRIEIYPDPPNDPRPKWYARSVDTGGYILKVTGGSFDQSWVIQNAQERWPGISVHMLTSAGEDSKWVEDGTRGVFPSVGPPVRRLWAGAGQ
jgi:hypothetical protein